MRWPIRNQILVPFAVTMLIALAGVSVLDAYLAARRSAQQIERQLANVAHTLSDASFPLTDTTLARMHQLSGADFLLTDNEGLVHAASRPLVERFEGKTAATDPLALFRFSSRATINDEDYFQTTVRLKRASTRPTPELLHILYPERIWHESQWAAALPSLIVGGVSLVAVVLLSLIIADRLGRPIAELRTQVGNLTQAEFHEIPLPRHDDELRDLVLSVNRLAQQLDAMRHAIQRNERLVLLGQLAGGLAHHLRNDVTGARMAVQLHQRQCTAGDHETLSVALRQLALTEEHLKRFLAAGKPPTVHLATCDLSSVIADLATLVEPSLKHRKIRFQTTVEPLPPAPADPDQLRHLLVNLVLNAADAAGPGGWVALDMSQRDNQWIEVRVRDSGRGPGAEIAERLFEPFATDKPEGVGLGLAVARQIAEAHGGSLGYVRSEGATCFTLRLPRQATAPLPAANSEAAEPLTVTS